MSEEKTVSKAEYDALAAKLSDMESRLETENAKKTALLDDLKKAQREARAAKDITPEAYQAALDRGDKAEAAEIAAQKVAKDATAALEKATKALEAEQGAARSHAIEAVLANAVSENGILPQLAKGFIALHRDALRAEIVDGQYVVSTTDGRPPKDYFTEVATGDDGKAWRAAAHNSGGGATGGSTSGGGSKTVTRAQFDAMDHGARAAFAKEGGSVVPEAA